MQNRLIFENPLTQNVLLKSNINSKRGLKFQSHCHFNQRLFISFLTVIVFLPSFLFGQSFECVSPPPSQELYSEMRNEVPLIQKFIQQQATPLNNVQIPVYFTVVRDADGIVQGPLSLNITNADVDAQISYLNSIYIGTGLEFYRLGNVNYIDHNVFNYNNYFGSIIIAENYSYVKTALNVYLRQGAGGYTPQPGTNPPTSLTKDNTSVMQPNYFLSTGKYAHETGHNFGLLHTFGIPQLYNYPAVLSNPSQVDHPTGGLFPRELVIRPGAPPGNYNFETPNCDLAGDLCCDTQADCAGIYNPNTMIDSYAQFFPAFDPSNVSACLANPNNCVPGCEYTNCVFSGLYRDYNEQLVLGEPNNIMATAYHDVCNPLMLTDCQKGRVEYKYQTFWSNKIADLPINVSDSRISRNDDAC